MMPTYESIQSEGLYSNIDKLTVAMMRLLQKFYRHNFYLIEIKATLWSITITKEYTF